MPSENVDAQLYNGFFSDADRAAMKIVLETEPRNLPALDITFADELQMLYQQYADDKEKLAQLKALWQYAQDIV